MTTTNTVRPNWYSKEDDTAWTKVKAAFQRDWQQTKHDMGAKVQDLNQQVGDTVSQAAGSQLIPPRNVPTTHPEQQTEIYREQDEPAYRYGYAAYRHYTPEIVDNDDADTWEMTQERVRNEWGDEREFEQNRDAIRRGWNFGRLERRRITPK